MWARSVDCFQMAMGGVFAVNDPALSYNAPVPTVTLTTSGKRFDAACDETVLEAAQRAGIALPYSCRGGVCGSCKAILVEGVCDYPRNPPVALGEGARADGAILLCQAVPRGDIAIRAREIASVEDIPHRRVDVEVVARRELAPEVVGVWLKPVDGSRLNWLPGQYLDVVLDDGRHRPFSIASGPVDDGSIELHVRYVPGGGFTTWVYESLKVGDRLTIEAPLGTFVPREDSERPMLFMAGGTGFAPVKAIVEHFIELGTRRPMHVYWGARQPEDLYLIELARGWERRMPGLRFMPVLSDIDAAWEAGIRAGLVHEALLEDHPDLSGFDVYMSGPPPMIELAREHFAGSGLPDDRLYFDSFELAPDVLAEILRSRAGIHGL